MKNLNGVSEYTVTDEDYQKVYGSDNDYTAAFTPSHPASKSISDILDEVYPDAEDGKYVVANYNVSDTDPVFGSGPTPPTPGFTMTSVLTKDLAVGENVTVNGVVTAVCNAGIILTDKAGSILVYAKEFPAADYKVGDQVVATGELANYKNCLQLPYADNLQKVGTQSYTYPTATEFTPAMLLAARLERVACTCTVRLHDRNCQYRRQLYQSAFRGSHGCKRLDLQCNRRHQGPATGWCGNDPRRLFHTNIDIRDFHQLQLRCD